MKTKKAIKVAEELLDAPNGWQQPLDLLPYQRAALVAVVKAAKKRRSK